MAFEHKDGSGSLFKNDKKGNDRAPDYKGDICVNGEVMEIAAWLKEGKAGKFMSLSVKPKQTARERTMGAVRNMKDDDLDVPFDNPYKGRICYVV